ncbi:MAG: hypothetical protein JWQ81_7392 [Amycolatopsis sp.]|uniref:copper resistance CopC/CopD family protein n=1 Tax=Amycolatopsis sp. TaxID=37632 RepID=UPI002638481B|nr:copper resistance protein CopC [Amycolatopsis sp.]MCU1686653.1 hypothetical protein [Amycolatopsis sp.]
MSRTRTRLRLAVVAGFLLAGAGLATLAAGPASAHAEPAGSVPADGSTVDRSPATLDLRLTEQVELAATKVSLVDGSGRQLATGTPQLIRAPTAAREDPVTVRIPLPPLAADTYRLAWSTVSSDDLHATSGTLVFGVRRPVAPATAGAPSDPLPGWGEVLGQAAIYLGLGGWMGSILLLSLLRSTDAEGDLPARARSRLLRAGAVAAAIGFTGGVALLLVRAAAFDGDPIRVAWRLVNDSSVGTPWLARQGAGAGMILLSAVALRGKVPGRVLFSIAGALALVAALSTALQGHLSISGPLLLSADTLHILATMVWAGTVISAGVVLLSARDHRVLARAVLRRFGLIATSALTVLVATGLLLTGDRVASLDALLLSTYGRILLLKVSVVALAALAGLVTTLRLHGRRGSPGRAFRAVPLETVLLGLTLFLTAGLVSTQQASGPQWRPAVTPAASTSTSADDLVETVDVRPNLPGRNFVTVNVFDTRRPSPGPIRAVQVVLRGPDGTTVTRTASPAGPNAYLLATDDLKASGPWEITVTAARPDLNPASGTVVWDVSPSASVARQPTFSLATLEPYTGWLAMAVALCGGSALALLRRRTRRLRDLARPRP